jgi:hypothetical protein
MIVAFDGECGHVVFGGDLGTFARLQADHE